MTLAGHDSTGTVTSGNPFIGLRPFDIDDSDRFFGRNKQVYELLRRLHTLHFVAVLGPSGCGKSSIIRAGVLAALRAGYLAEDGDWKIVIMEPGAAPLDAWMRGLEPHLRAGKDRGALLTEPVEALDTSNGRIAILVDQFEDLLKHGDRSGRSEDVSTFIKAMMQLGRADARIHVVLTMRAEYLPRCAAYPDLSDAINEGLYLVPRMDREQIRQAVVGQVRAGGDAITTELLERLLDDVTGEDDGLPLLQHALMRIWPKRERWEPLGMSLYPAEGGIATFIDQHAERVYRDLPSDQHRAAAESLFRAITERTPDGRVVRRPASIEQVAAASGMDAGVLRDVAEAFRRDGFVWIKPSHDGAHLVDVAHEAVARQWKRLGVSGWDTVAGRRQWRDAWAVIESREQNALTRFENAAREWVENDRNRAYLFRGAQLDRAITELGPRRRRLSGTAEEFVTAGRRWSRWDTLVSPRVVILVTLVAAGLGWIVVYVVSLQGRTEVAESTQQLAVGQAEAAETRLLQTQTEYRELVQLTPTGGNSYPQDPVKPGTSPSPPARPRSARLYTQAWTKEQAANVGPVLQKLTSPELTVTPFEIVAVGASRNELRYFRKEDDAEAQRIGARLAEASVNARVKYVPGFETSTKIRERHFELWLAPPALVVPPVGQPTSGLTQPPDGGDKPEARLPPPRITFVASSTPAGGRYLYLTLGGEFLDTEGQFYLGDVPIPNRNVVIQVLEPYSGARFATRMAIILYVDQGLISGRSAIILQLVNKDGQRASARIVLPRVAA